MTHIDSKCPDCQVEAGRPHLEGCDVARCLHDGGQRLQHEMVGGTPTFVEIVGVGHVLDAFQDGHDCGKDIWTGQWPGVVECEQYGWYAYFAPNGNPSWRPCAADHPGAVHDLNRLAIDCTWDRQALKRTPR